MLETEKQRIAENIKFARRASYLTRQEFCEAAGINTTALSLYETKRRMPTVPVARRLYSVMQKNNNSTREFKLSDFLEML